MNQLMRYVPAVIVVALLVAFGLTLVETGGQKTLRAHFPRTVSLYEGSDVRVLGVPVGKVTEVRPNGSDVLVTMEYDDEVQVPADAKAVIVAPSVVGDRYVQLAPAYTGGAELADDTVLGLDRTSAPLELDDIYGSLDQLVVALGPDGANKEGALNDLLKQTAANFGGQGERFHQTVTDLSKLTTTLDNNKDQVFGSAAKLEKFIRTLAQNDKTVRDFGTSLAQASKMLAGERNDLAAALENLSLALADVSGFVKKNKESIKTNITGLKRVAGVLVKRRGELEETLRTAPLALTNLLHTYNPDTGTLDTNANLTMLADQLVSEPSMVLCTLVNQLNRGGELCDLIDSILPRAGAFGAGSGTSVGQRTDPTLGGLVKVRE